MTLPAWYRLLPLVAALTLLGGCATIGPAYTAPDLPLASQWQAPQAHDGRLASLLDWWQQLDDPVLHGLLAVTEQQHPSLQSALAAIDSARADVDTAAQAGVPSASLSTGVTRQRSSGISRSSALDASWEIDLWGKLQRNHEAATARLQASEAGWHDARASLAAELANYYVNYRASQLQTELAQLSRQSQQDSTDATRVLVKAGFSSAVDGADAEAALASADNTLLAQQAETELYLKALVAVSGMPEAELRALLASQPARLPAAANLQVDSVPADLLRQRPDLQAAERQLAAASADIGVAEAGRYPQLSLAGTLSASRNQGRQQSSWSFGPTLSLPLLDGGSSQAAVTQAGANYRQTQASYQSSVRSAVQEVEQALVRVDSSRQREAALSARHQLATGQLAAVNRQWQAGTASVLALGSALRSSIASQQDLITLQRDRLLYTLALYKALGGGWITQNESQAS
ncbi:efflux transporter outer membrane subunit [Vogesella sp. DC21W]|uniref:Efflux transporter outer membrane subunit n=1 Tax=Vogesella aquatica TaxID=2984206 RepID=A0ABT5IZ55_9NEIS|nr:efflux transporter outer membrane subunit [Vogesella aquatica]MDC7717849.1 efflux transporter outer membrane subunit [Vogesella aquatica]